jgi:DNA-binding NtrC family response regulator
MNSKILIVDDNEDILIATRLLLKDQVSKVTTISSPFQIKDILSEEPYDVILLDMNFTKDLSKGEEGFYWLKEILKVDPLAVVILITAYGDVNIAVRAIKEGATDFILKPWENEKLWATISSALKLRQSRKETANLKQTQKHLISELNLPFKNFIGVCPAMREIFNIIDKVAVTDANVLILGENGTGKELVARALHSRSYRKEKPFISVDIGSLSNNLFESELFGHLKGSFTDALEDRTGRLEIADGGTLFLDEIGNLSLNLQSKLLTVLEKKEVTRLGSNHSRPIDIRLISATNTPIYGSVKENIFRQDLLYRINTVEINLPPLRERIEDIPYLTEFYMKKYSNKYNKEKIKFDERVLNQFEKHHWPGNVRELQHSIERAIIMSTSNTIRLSDFSIFNHDKSNSQKTELNTTFRNLRKLEKNTIFEVLVNNNGHISNSAKDLGITRASLYRRLKKYDL